MKVVPILLSVFALCNGASASSLGLLADLLDLLGVIPIDDYKALANEYLKSDQDFVNAVAYLQGDDWRQLVETVEDLEEVQMFLEYLTDAGIPIDSLLEAISQIIANADTSLTNGESDGSLREFIDEVRALFPTQEFIALVNDKLANSEDFQEFYALISSDKARRLVENVRSLYEVQRIVSRLRELGLDIDAVIDTVNGLLGWN